jgi:hypothetical protein
MEDEVSRTPAEKMRELSSAASADATLASGRGDKEGSMYARGLRDAYATAAHIAERPAGPVTTPDPALMRREGDEVQCRLGPDADLVIDASHCLVICTPERRITVGDVHHWCSSLAEGKATVALLDQLADEERRAAQADRLRAERRPGRAG